MVLSSLVRISLCTLVVLLASYGLGACNQKLESQDNTGNNASTASAASATKLITPKDLIYQGAFRLPDGPEEYAWSYSGQGLTYYPGGDPNGPKDQTPGSLFGTGHDWHQHVSEITIPEPVISKSKKLEELNTATTLQPFADVRGDLFPGDLEQARCDIEYLSPQSKQKTAKLYFCWGPHMHDSQAVPSHGMCELDLKNPRPSGPWKLADLLTYLTCDYIFSIDPAWAARNTPGMLLATGRFRDGGQGSMGPALFAYGPWNDGNPPKRGASLKAVPLLRYASINDGAQAADRKLENYHHSDDWAGGSWLTSGDRTAVIFVGTKGQGKCWYGFANGVVWPEEGPWPEVPPHPNDQRGWWSTEFAGKMLFYDPDDLAAVVAGKKEAWQPQPYAVMDLAPFLYGVTSKQKTRQVGDVTFDRQRGLIYMVEFRGDGDKSLIHVWKIADGDGSVAPPTTGDKARSSPADSTVSSEATVDTTKKDSFASEVVATDYIVVDHSCIDAKDQLIPTQYLDRARQLDMYFGHQSVGGNLIEGLEQLAQENSKRYRLEIVENPQAAWFDANGGLAHFFIGDNYNPSSKIKHFFNQVANQDYGDHVGIAAMKFCYVDVESNTNVEQVWSDYRETMEKLARQYPRVRFVWITCPVVANDSNGNRNALNKLMRRYCASHKQVLFDLADIESHTARGKPCRIGGFPSLCKAYSADGEHPDSDAGKRRLARAWWWLMSRLSGWTG